MERAAVSASTPATSGFRDGLGERRHITDPSGKDTLELLCLRSELSAVPSFEFALRERVSRLANFHHPQFGRARGVERLTDVESSLAVVSERGSGVRLSDLLAAAEQRGLRLDITASLCLIRQLVPAIAALHEGAREVAHGAIGPERLVVMPDGQLMIVEYVLGAALEQLRYPRERYWNELRVALPSSAGLPRFDQRADITQMGVVALSLILGRPMRGEEYPSRIAEVVASTWAISPRGGLEPLPQGLRSWLGRSLQLDIRTAFTTAAEARAELDKVLGEGDYVATPANLTAFLARYSAAESGASMTPYPPLMRPSSASAPTDAPLVKAPVAPAFDVANRPVESAMTSAAALSSMPTPPRGTPPMLATTPSGGFDRTALTPPRGTPRPAFSTATQTIAAASAGQASVAAQTPPPRGTPREVALAASVPASSMTPPAGMPSLASAPTPPPAPALQIQALADSVTLPAPAYGTPGVSTSAAALTPAYGMPGLSIPAAARTPPYGTPRVSTSAAAQTPPRGVPRAAISATAPRPATVAVATSKPVATIEAYAGVSAWPSRWPTRMAAAVAFCALVGAGALTGKWIFMPAPEAVTTGTLVITTNPSGAQATVDGRPRGVTPLRLDLSAGPHKVELKVSAGSRTVPVIIAAGAQLSQYIEMLRAASGVGQLVVRTEPAGAKVTVDGVARGTSPMTVAALAEGEHVVLLNGELGSATHSVTIDSGATAQLMVPMTAAEGAPVSGWVAVTSPIELQVFESDRLLGSSRSDRIMVSTGRHDIELVNEELGYRSARTVEVTAGRVAPVAVEMPTGTIALSAAPWAEVWVDGTRVGETPIGSLPLAIGTHDVVFRHPELGEERHAATVTLKDVTRLSVEFKRP